MAKSRSGKSIKGNPGAGRVANLSEARPTAAPTAQARAAKPVPDQAQPRLAKRTGPARAPSRDDKATAEKADTCKSPAQERKAARRAAILEAGLVVFAEHGFEAARLDEVAARAGVAKGTLYLYFADKTALFEEIIRNAVAPLIDRFEELARVPDLPTAQVLETFFELFVSEVLGTKRKLVLRLIIAEGPRFPAIARFYHREVVSRGLAIVRRIAERGLARGELPDDTLVRFPQLLLSAPLLAVLWDGLFSDIEPMDFAGLLSAHGRLLVASPTAPTTPRRPAP